MDKKAYNAKYEQIKNAVDKFIDNDETREPVTEICRVWADCSTLYEVTKDDDARKIANVAASLADMLSEIGEEITRGRLAKSFHDPRYLAAIDGARDYLFEALD